MKFSISLGSHVCFSTSTSNILKVRQRETRGGKGRGMDMYYSPVILICILNESGHSHFIIYVSVCVREKYVDRKTRLDLLHHS